MSFDSTPYPIKFVQEDIRWQEPPVLSTLIFKFKSRKKGHRFVLLVERYPEEFLVVKYYLQALAGHPHRFGITHQSYEAARIFCTVASILPVLLEKYPLASIGFLGAQSYDAYTRRIEPRVNNQRYRIYGGIVERFIGTSQFELRIDPENSGYLLINRKSPHGAEAQADRILHMLNEHYDLGMTA